MEDTTPDFQDLLAAFDIPDMRVKISEVRSLAPVTTSASSLATSMVTTKDLANTGAPVITGASAVTGAPAITTTVKQEPVPAVVDAQAPWQQAGQAENAVHQTGALQAEPQTEDKSSLELPGESPAAAKKQVNRLECLLNGSATDADGTGSFFQPPQEKASSAQHAKVVSSTLMANSWANANPASTNPTASAAPKAVKSDKPPAVLASFIRYTPAASSAQPSSFITSPITACVRLGVVNNSKHSKAPPLIIGSHVQYSNKSIKPPSVIVDFSDDKNSKVKSSTQPGNAVNSFPGFKISRISSADLLKRINPIPRFIPSPSLDHQRTALEVRGQKKCTETRYPCQECGDIFLVQSSLKLHMERRSVHIAFCCPYCLNRHSLTFYNKCSFYAHLRQHSQQLRLKINFTSQVSNNATVSSLSYSKYTTPGNIILSDVVKVPQGEETAKSSADNKQTPSVEETGDPANSQEASIVHATPPAADGNACPICRIKLTSESAVQAHMQHYARNTNSACDSCQMALPNRCQQRAHSIMHIGLADKLTCPECARGFTDVKAFYCHVSNNCMYWYRQLRQQCKLCSKMVSDYLQHLDKGHEMLFYRCVSCSMAFKTLPSLKDHSEQKHKVQPGSPLCRIISKCPFCETVFMQKPLLLAHIRTHIQQDSSPRYKAWVYCCPRCSTTFGHLTKFKKHMVASHPSAKHFYCDFCRQNFQNYEQLEYHFQTGKASHGSPGGLCMGAKFRHMRSSRDSVKNDEGVNAKPPEISKSPSTSNGGKKEEQPLGKLYVKKTHSCPGCRKSGKAVYFFKEEDLRHHVAKAHPEMKLSSISADECVKYVTIRPKEDLDKKADDGPCPEAAENSRKRKNIESGDGKRALKRPKFALPTEFTCAKHQCFYQGKDRAEFKTHIQSHRHDRSLPQCEECGMCFRIDVALKRHLFIQHGIREYDAYNRLLRGATPSPPPEDNDSSPTPDQETTPQVSPPTPSAGVPDKATLLECQVCYKTFKNEGNLRAHMRNHGMAFIRSKRSISND